MRILIVGATGFVGRALTESLVKNPNFQITVAVRAVHSDFSSNIEQKVIDGLSDQQDWSSTIAEQDVVIQLAARVHVMAERSDDPLTEFRKINVAGTLHLAQQASNAEVKRFIFISSIKVNGEATTVHTPYLADSKPAPTDSYGISKLEAELGLIALSNSCDMELVVIRPVLVYGPGVQANFLSMMRWLHKGIPLPLGAINNMRSLVSVENLVDLIITCITHPAAANQTFLVSDGEDMSTTTLLQRIGVALGREPLLLPIPISVLKFGARLLGKQAMAQRICGSLTVDISKTRDLLAWQPPVTVENALRKTAKYFLENISKG